MMLYLKIQQIIYLFIFILDYRNFEIVHEERSKIGWCRELPFKSWRHVPDSLHDKPFKVC